PRVCALTRRERRMGRRTLGLLWMAGILGCGGAGPAPAARPVGAAPGAVEASATPPPQESASPARCARRHPGVGPSRVDDNRQGSAAALARLGGVTLAYAADADDDAIHTFDVDRGAELAVTPLPGSPAQLLVLADGRVAATLTDTNRVIVLEPGERAD